MQVRGLVTPGNRFATRAIPAGEFVRQYGQPIGTSRGIDEGDPVTPANMSNDVPVVRDLDPGLHTPPPDYVPEAERRTFLGFRRPDGRIGTRNFVLVVPTSMCASHEATQIATIAEFTGTSRERFPNVDGVVAIPHNKGCGCSDGSTIEVMLRTLGNYADHPERRRRRLHRPGVREDQPHGDGAVPRRRISRTCASRLSALAFRTRAAPRRR